MLTLEALCAGYEGVRGRVLGPVDLIASPGQFICILGRNGAGKSTLMRTISGLQTPLQGDAKLNDEVIAEMRPNVRARNLAVVLTERSFSAGLKVDDVVSLGRQPFTAWDGRLTEEDDSICASALESAGAAQFRGRFFEDLSDGERQRVLIARAIAQTAQVMVLDEITAFLDLPGRVEIMSLLRRHAREAKACVLLSSHDLDLSLELADQIWLLDGKGDLVVGSADHLIAAGAIGAAFDTPEVAFSATRKRFELKR